MTRRGIVALLGALYLAQGLPFGFFSQALPVLLRDAGYSLTEIGAVSLLSLPWGVKFLWATVVDRFGTRRRWLLVLQLLAAVVATLLAFTDLTGGVRAAFVVIALANFVAATQDVATDGLAITLLTPHDRGLGNGVQVGAYRLGMIVGGGALLWVYAEYGWAAMALTMAGLLLLTVVPVLWLRESPRSPVSGPGAGAGVAMGWWPRLWRRGMPTFVVLVVVYKFGDALGSALVGPFLRDLGLTLSEIAVVKGTLASGGVLLGAAVGGWVAHRHGRRVALLVGGGAQVGWILLFLAVALGAGGVPMAVVATVGEGVLGGLATVALFTLMMDAAEPAHAGTDYSLLACAVVVSQGAAVLGAGVIGDVFGYATVFGLAALTAVGGVVALVVALDRGHGPAGVRATWRGVSGRADASRALGAPG